MIRPIHLHFARWKFAAVSLTILVLGTIVAPALSSRAGATSGCGTYSYGFEGTRLINDGISNVSGPYEIELPAGIYTVTLVAHDHHDTQVGVPSQPGEQYVIELDSGYTSPRSDDIPDDLIMTVSDFQGQRLEASSEITVRHGGVPGVNSVDVVCVGFTLEAAADPSIEDPTRDTPGVEVPPIEPPVQDISDPLTIVREPQATPPASIVPEVKGTIEVPPITPQLAITGPGDHVELLVVAGAILTFLGALLVRRERRITT